LSFFDIANFDYLLTRILIVERQVEDEYAKATYMENIFHRIGEYFLGYLVVS